jgi:hypothetical protein
VNYSDAFLAIADARRTVANGDIIIRELAALMVGRLRTADIHSQKLVALKRELRDFDCNTKKWKAKR